MTISPKSDIGQEIIYSSRALFKGMKGAILNFQRLCTTLKTSDEFRAAEIAELLCRRDVNVLKHVYFFLDGDDLPILLKDSVVYEYIRTGKLYSPISNELVGADLADNLIVIEFEVIV